MSILPFWVQKSLTGIQRLLKPLLVKFKTSNQGRVFTVVRPRSNKYSKYFRKLFESKLTRNLVGTSLAGITLAIALVAPRPIVGEYSSPVIEVISLSSSAINLTTTESIRYPVETYQINQRFSSWHPGVDLDGEMGDDIHPILKGKILEVNHHKYAYGNHIIIDHGLGLISLYAHMQETYVEPNQEVTTDSILGTVGTTGHSTGPHLHLEVIDQGRRINPLSFIGE